LADSINGNLLKSKYPAIKIVDLGNALSYNRNINTFEVQSLYYRAPEVLFGNEMTAQIDLWSIGCILLELININEYNKSSYFGSNHSSSNSKSSSFKRRHHHALFACCNKIELAKKIQRVLTPYPLFVYNKYESFYYDEIKESFDNDQRQKERKAKHNQSSTTSSNDDENKDNNIDDDEDQELGESKQNEPSDGEHEVRLDPYELCHLSTSYKQLKILRRNSLLKRLNICKLYRNHNNNNKYKNNAANIKLEGIKQEYIDFIDLIACLLDVNPSTRYTSEDAIQHPFITSIEYIENDNKALSFLESSFESVYPLITISTDNDRQYRINEQMKKYSLHQRMEHSYLRSLSNLRNGNGNNNGSMICPIPIPREMTLTKKNNNMGFIYAPSINNNTPSHSVSAVALNNIVPSTKSSIHINGNISHNKVICLFNGCCGNPCIRNQQQMNDINDINDNNDNQVPPAKKTKFNSDQ